MNSKFLLNTSCFFVLSWGFFFLITANINFFWEDIYFFKSSPASALQNIPTATAIFFSPYSLTNLDYGYRPLQDVLWSTLHYFFGKNTNYYRILKSIIPALLATFLFAFFSSQGQIMYGIFASVLFSVFTELFISLLYSADTMLYMHILTASALLIFFFVYLNELNNLLTTTMSIFGIVFFARTSMLFKHEGRIVLPIILIFAIICRRDLLKRASFWIMMLFLLVLTQPILCSPMTCFENVASVTGATHTNFFVNFFSKLSTVVYIIKIPVLLLFILPAITLFYFCHNKKTKCTVQQTRMLHLTIFCFLWLVHELILVYAAKGLQINLYLGSTFQRLDFAIIVFPLILAVFSLVITAKERINKSALKTIFITLIIFLSITSIIVHAIDLNSWRGGWSEYLIGWDFVRKKIEISTNNSLLIAPIYTYAQPSLFLSNNTFIITDIYNFTHISNFTNSHTHIFAGDRTLSFTPNTTIIQHTNYFKNCEIIIPKDMTPFGRFKEALTGIQLKGALELCEYNLTALRELQNSIKKTKMNRGK